MHKKLKHNVSRDSNCSVPRQTDIGTVKWVERAYGVYTPRRLKKANPFDMHTCSAWRKEIYRKCNKLSWQIKQSHWTALQTLFIDPCIAPRRWTRYIEATTSRLPVALSLNFNSIRMRNTRHIMWPMNEKCFWSQYSWEISVTWGDQCTCHNAVQLLVWAKSICWDKKFSPALRNSSKTYYERLSYT